MTLLTKDLSNWVSFSPKPGADLIVELRGLAAERGAIDWLDGSGEIAEPLLSVLTGDGRRSSKVFDGHWDLVSLRGGSVDGELVLSALVTRVTDAGAETAGGILLSGDVIRCSLVASFQNAPAAQALKAPAPEILPPAPRPAPPTPVSTGGAPAPQASPQPVGPPGARQPPPRRPVELDDVPEIYPEEGDVVTHFAFGFCTVVFSDGERIRLQQDGESRVREVALSILRVSAPTDREGKRHFQLTRKN